MKISREREEEIVELANAVAEEYFSTGKIDPLEIASKNEITVSHGRYEDAFDGMLESSHGRFHIYCNLNRVEYVGSVRDRFTLGHELGHFYIDEHRHALESGMVTSHHSFCEQFDGGTLAELEADLFAANLLMPPSRFRSQACRAPKGLSGVLQLHKSFNASITSTCVQYVRAAEIPCAMIKWSPEVFQWRWVSRGAWALNFRNTLDQMNELPSDSATARSLAGETDAGKDFNQAIGTTAFWFANVAGGGNRDLLFVEEAIRLGRYGAITLLYPHGSSEKAVKELLAKSALALN